MSLQWKSPARKLHKTGERSRHWIMEWIFLGSILGDLQNISNTSPPQNLLPAPDEMKKSSYQINSSVKHSGASLSNDQSKKTDVKQHLKNRPIPSQHAPIGEQIFTFVLYGSFNSISPLDGIQHNSCRSKLHDLTGELKQPACKARENHTSAEDNKVTRQKTSLSLKWRKLQAVFLKLIDYQKPEGVGAQVKVSVVWIQGGLILGNLAVLVTALVLVPIFLSPFWTL